MPSNVYGSKYHQSFLQPNQYGADGYQSEPVLIAPIRVPAEYIVKPQDPPEVVGDDPGDEAPPLVTSLRCKVEEHASAPLPISPHDLLDIPDASWDDYRSLPDRPSHPGLDFLQTR
jgi:hypothetical protein